MVDVGRGRSEIKESAGPHIARAQRRAAEFVSRYDRLSARRPLWTVPREFARTYRRLNCSLLAGAIAFRTFLWLMPFVLFAVGILSAFGTGDGGLKIAHHLGFTGAAADQIRDALDDGHKSWYVAALIGLLGVATSGLSLIRNIYLAYGRIWDLEPRPLRRRLRNLTALIGGVAALLAVRGLVGHVGNVRPLTAVAIVAVQFVVIAAVWLWISWWLPHSAVDWRDLLPGALLMTVAFSVLYAVSAFYLPQKVSKASSLYGGLGVAFALLAWLLVIAYVIVSAGVLNAVWWRYRRAAQTVEPHGGDRPSPAVEFSE